MLPYVPLAFIPQLTLLSTFFLGHGEGYRLPRCTVLFCWISAAVSLFVLLNDLHRLVFVFPPGLPPSDRSYSYGAGFLVPALWEGLCLLLIFVMLLLRSRVPDKGKRLLMPLICGLLLILYNVIYISGMSWLRRVLGDTTATNCMLVIALIECCLRCGLLSSNTHYGELFRIGCGSAVIVDEAYRARIASESYTPVPEALMRQTERETVLLENGLRIASAPIEGGRVLWTEDVSELLTVTAELVDQRDYLLEQVIMLQKEVETRKKGQRLYEQNRLFGKVIGRTQKMIDLFSGLSDALERSTDPADERLLTMQLAILCTHIKRSVNLVFIEEIEGVIAAEELLYAVQEWFITLRIAAVRCDCTHDLHSAVAFSEMLYLYDRMTRILLTAADGMQTLFLRITEQDGRPLLTMDMNCTADLTFLAAADIAVEREAAGEWSLRLTPPEGGADL